MLSKEKLVSLLPLEGKYLDVPLGVSVLDVRSQVRS